MPYTTDDVLPQLPYLRRHARLLSGSKEVGDEYVRLCLELLLEEPARLEVADLRVGLFAAFHAVWHAVNVGGADASATEFEERVEQGLASLPPLDRRILLLVAVEDFSPADVAAILQIDAASVADHLAAARSKLNERVSLPVLIIEDEPMIAMELRQLVQEMGLHVTQVVAREGDAIASASAQRPHLILADIQLQDDDSGIAAAQAILQASDVPIVFVTGYPERLLTGEGLEPAFVVAKPFKADGLKVTIAHALSTYATLESAVAHRTKLLAKLRYLTGKELNAGRGAGR